jgi:maltose alpha-D-glucosyltransferase/alpha-amylase
MCFHFPLMPRIYMAIAQEDRFPIADILRQTPDIPANCQWALFLRNHDELTLEMVTDSERDYLWSTYASDPRARINLGIRRRLAPLMDNDRRKIELMKALLMSLPGTPVLYYGDEIGMGDNIYLGDRNGVRTPMQWSPDRNGGFSRCDPAKLFLPVIMDPVYGYESVNVEAQSRSLASLLNWTKRLISVRKSMRVFGRGTLTFVRPKNRAVLVYVRQYQNETILCVANMARSAQAAEIDLSPWRGRVPVEMLGRTRFPRIGELPYLLTLPPYGYFWFDLQEHVGGTQEISSPLPEFITLVLAADHATLLDPWSERAFERDVLPAFLATRRWFADKDVALRRARLHATIPVQSGNPVFFLALVDTETDRGASRYALPLTIDWHRIDKTSRPAASVIAAVRRGPREGTLLDATADTDFIRLLLRKLHAGENISAAGIRLAFHPTSVFQHKALAVVESVHPVNREQSNTTVIVDASYVVKLLRRVKPGIHPEEEIGRFLTDVAGYQNTPALLGAVELVQNGESSALAVVHQFVENQGDAWTVSNGYLDRFIDDQRVLTSESPADDTELQAYLLRMRTIGRRTAELHRALASHDGIPDFAPEPIAADDIAAWTGSLVTRARNALDALAERRPRLSAGNQELTDRLLANGEQLITEIEQLLPCELDSIKIRHHGDLHLGQMLIVKDDVFIIDFEGEPQRSVEERRRKASALRDVAGLIRSIDYSATAAIDRIGQVSAEELARLRPALDNWRDAAAEAFLTAYRETAAGHRLLPANADHAARLLRFFLLEKALYEVEYELANRPDWLHVPLAGALRILQGPVRENAKSDG